LLSSSVEGTGSSVETDTGLSVNAPAILSIKATGTDVSGTVSTPTVGIDEDEAITTVGAHVKVFAVFPIVGNIDETAGGVTVGEFVVTGVIVGVNGQHVLPPKFFIIVQVSLSSSVLIASKRRSPHVFPLPISTDSSTESPLTHTAHGLSAGSGQQLSSVSFIRVQLGLSASRRAASTITSAQVFSFPTIVDKSAVIPDSHTEQGSITAEAQHIASSALNKGHEVLSASTSRASLATSEQVNPSTLVGLSSSIVIPVAPQTEM